MQLAHEAARWLGPVEVRPATLKVAWPGGCEVLQPRVMQVLVALAQAAGEVVGREDLIAACWDGRIVSEDAVNVVVAQVRKLGQRTGAFELETISRVGYRLVVAGAAAAAAEPKPVLDRRSALTLGVVGVAAAGAGGGVAAWRFLGAGRGPVTVAVLPFSGEGGVSPALMGGLAREVRNHLCRVAGLRVVADASASAAAAENGAAPATAARLQADWLVDGRVAADGEGVRISLSLRDADRGRQLWTQTVSGRADELFATLDRVSLAVVAEVAGRLPEASAARPPPRARDGRAFLPVMEAETELARTRMLRVETAEVSAEAAAAADRAARQAQAALAIDRNDVRALLVLATLARNGWSNRVTPPGATPAARRTIAADYVGRALLADPNDAAALGALGDLRRREWRWSEAESLLARAVAGDPSLVEARFAYGSLLATLGRGLEARAQAEELVRLDPLDGWRRGFLLSRVRYLVGDRAGAVAGFQAMIDRPQPSLFAMRELMLMRLAERDATALAALADDVRTRAAGAQLAALQRRAEAGVAALQGRPQGLIAMVDADVAAYEGGGAAKLATQQGRTSGDLLFLAAVEYAWAGATDRALDLLDRALAQDGLWPASLPFGILSFPAEVRAAPRYAALWGRDERRVELAARRLAALRERQMAGVLPDGRRAAARTA